MGWCRLDKGIGTKLCYKLVHDISGEIIYRSTTNLQVDPITPHQEDNAILDTEDDAMLDEFISLADFDMLFLRSKEKEPVDSFQ